VHLFGLTGGIASGKSAVAARLRSRGVPINDADALARDAVAVGTPGLAEVVTAFGEDVLTADGALDRKKVAAIVFTDDEKRKLLNSIVHPRVTALTLEHAARLRDAGEALGCYEAALIVENGLADMFRPLVVVAAPEDVQVARACARDQATPEEARARIRAQMPLAEKTKVADHVIENDGTLAALLKKTDGVLVAICTELGVDPVRYGAPESGGDRIGSG
jgi:dephospho-CoA kinase